MNKNICFLFGAGAESKQNYGLPTGTDFMKSSFLDEKTKMNLTAALKDYFNKYYFEGRYAYTTHTYLANVTFLSILKKWIFKECVNMDFYRSHKDDIKSVLNRDDLKELLSPLPKDDNSTEDKDGDDSTEDKDEPKYKRDNLVKLFQSLFSTGKIFGAGPIEKAIPNKLLRVFVDEIKNNEVIFKRDLPTGIAHILDGHFHTIIDPPKYGRVKFSKVSNYYWSIFFAIYRPIRELELDNEVFDYTSELKSLRTNIKNLYDNTLDLQSKIFKNNATKTYYQSIAEEFADILVAGVITSNYFNFAEIIPASVAYLNGQLKLFEVPETLEVIDICENDLPEDKLFFPFIMGQSYTKPIVSDYQVAAFHQMGKYLKDASDLIILGYNVNEDDNHINAYLRKFLKSGKGKTIWVIEGKREEALTNLRLNKQEEGIKEYEGNYKKDSPEAIIQGLRKMIDARG